MTIDEYIESYSAFLPEDQKTLLLAAKEFYASMVQGQQGDGGALRKGDRFIF